MASLLFYFLITLAEVTNCFGSIASGALGANGLAEKFVSLLGVDLENFKGLSEKLGTINNYVIDRDKLSELIANETKESNLTKTNFYEALGEEDRYQFLHENETKSLYLRLKQRMNRNDILDIIEKRGPKNKLLSGRRFGGELDLNEDRDLDEAVDEMIAELPRDDHTYKSSETESVYWDPKQELQELQQFHHVGGRRLFKGERSTVRYYPFMASIHVMSRFWCGGSIVSSDMVLTSSSCLQLMHNNRFFRENPRSLSVRVGSNHSRLGGEVVDAQEVYFHPGYNPRTLRNNIAVIRLQRHLRFSYHRVPKLISFSRSSFGLAATAEVLLLGWGVTKISQKLAYEPIFLQRKILPVYPNVFCKEVYGDKFVAETMFCAGTMTTGEGACDHDAGGPAILGGKLMGVISFGPSICGFPNAPTVFTLVGAYADWIETINETMPQYYVGKQRTTTTTAPTPYSYIGTFTTPEARITPIQPRKIVRNVFRAADPPPLRA